MYNFHYWPNCHVAKFDSLYGAMKAVPPISIVLWLRSRLCCALPQQAALSQADLAHLDVYGFPCNFVEATWMAKAAKLRVLHTLAQDSDAKVQVLEDYWFKYNSRPFGSWHLFGAHYYTLNENRAKLEQHGVSCRDVLARLPKEDGMIHGFQKEAMKL